MEEKVKISQSANATEGTRVELSPDVKSIEIHFDGHTVSRLIIRMKD